jgi:D-lactate dehydrogenase
VAFCLEHLVDKLAFHPIGDAVAVHATCSAIKLGLDTPTHKLARMCARQVVAPPSIACCGWAGDRGFTVPELPASALVPLRREVDGACDRGYSTSRTCEIGLTLHSGIDCTRGSSTARSSIWSTRSRHR